MHNKPINSDGKKRRSFVKESRVRHEWHLLKLFRMTLSTNLFTGDGTMCAKQRERLGLSFDGSWLDTAYFIS